MLRAPGSARWLGLPGARVVLAVTVRLAALAALALAVVAAAPVSAVAAAGLWLAWLRGWSPRRLGTAGAWCGPMVLVWLIESGRASPGWQRLALAPYRAWLAFWRLAEAGSLAKAVLTVAPVAIPLGLLAGAAAWSYLIGSMRSGAGGLSPASSVAFDQRQWRHQVRSARARIAAPGSAPLIMRGDLLVVGAVIRAVGHRAGPLAAVSYQRMRSHQVVVGTTGTGKTTLLLRLWTG